MPPELSQSRSRAASRAGLAGRSGATPGPDEISDRGAASRQNPAVRFGLADIVFLSGLLAVALPTLVFVARETWSTEQGAHGPIVLMTGIWLIWNRWPEVRHLVSPPSPLRAWPLVAALLAFFAVTRVTHIVEVEGFVMYALVISAIYAIVGGAVIRALAFPLVYLAFIFPPPETIVYAITLPVKVAISEASVALLSFLGYPIGGTGVTIQIGQYQLLVAAACAGLNSIVSLSALTIFYIYVRHANHVKLAALLLLVVLPIAIMANFIRVLILILLTYYAGEAAGQGFMHDMAGITMFATALVLVVLCDIGFQKLLRPGKPLQQGNAV